MLSSGKGEYIGRVFFKIRTWGTQERKWLKCFHLEFKQKKSSYRKTTQPSQEGGLTLFFDMGKEKERMVPTLES